jgi:hypothetical protein
MKSETENIEPEPCPFCGKKPTIGIGGPGNLVWYIECERWDHIASFQHSGSRKTAVAKWNKRYQGSEK